MRLSLVLVIITFASYVTAQQTISGVVIDAQDGSPLPYVNVFLEHNQSRGVLTNENGEYAIKLYDFDATDNLVFSLLSYDTRQIPVLKATQNGFFNLKMQSSYLDLDVITVISDSGLKGLIRKARKAVHQNYPDSPYLLQTYARRYDIENDTFSLYAEALINIREKGFVSPDDRLDLRVKIEQYRGGEVAMETIRNRWKIMGTQSGLLSNYFYGDNIARSGRFDISTFRRGVRFEDIMTFTNRGHYLLGKDTIIRINFELAPELIDSLAHGDQRSVKAWFSGELHINLADFAVIKLAVGDPEATNFSSMSYQKHGEKYYPNHLSKSLRFNYNGESRPYFQSEELFVQAVITDE
ncbi:MAG: carboxypeptidase-like regulatory domain-containing protein, partial [Bacteroidota bacterium]